MWVRYKIVCHIVDTCAETEFEESVEKCCRFKSDRIDGKFKFNFVYNHCFCKHDNVFTKTQNVIPSFCNNYSYTILSI